MTKVVGTELIWYSRAVACEARPMGKLMPNDCAAREMWVRPTGESGT
jgi:hypothetical protein